MTITHLPARRPPFPVLPLRTALLWALLVINVPALAAESPSVEAGGGWARAEPAEVGLDPESVAAGVEEIGSMPGVRTLLVVADGALVVEEAFGGSGPGNADPGAPHNMKSASKSLLSLLTGIAVEEGKLRGVDERVAPLLGRELAGGREEIRLRHLLSMSSGLESTSGDGYGAWVSTDDWTAAALGRPLLGPAGEGFRYSTGNTHLLAAVLERATGDDLLAYARRELFDPLGIGAVSWQESPEGVRFGGNNLSMAPRDLARVGWMLLQGGRWGERQVVPEGWIELSTRQRMETPEGWGERYGDYAWLWWLPRGHGGAYTAVGYGGQFLYVAPEAGVAVVLTSTLEGKGTEWDWKVLEIFHRRFAGAAID